ncbi:hypothetical protein BG004_007626 [Podila humilis]|nr:hypothetical protein BG004_007626 [Podila humilis]
MPKVKDSGDALEDDFQLSDTEYLSDGQDAGEVFDDSGDEATASAGSKRKAPSTTEAPKKKKKVMTKKEKAEENNTPLGKRSKAAQIEALNDSQDRAQENLSTIERDERRIPEAAIKDVSPFALDHTLVHLESFLKFAVANWKAKLMVKDANATPSKFDPTNKKYNKKAGFKKQEEPKKKDPKKKPLETSSGIPRGSPVVLIISASGIRAVDVVRALPLFTEAAKVGKLFAKHLKVPEQVYFLENTVSHICVGTPNRVDKLISDGALKLDRLELVLLDCHLDAKRRTLLNMPEIRIDLFKMLGLEAFEDRLKNGQTQVALF